MQHSALVVWQLETERQLLVAYMAKCPTSLIFNIGLLEAGEINYILFLCHSNFMSQEDFYK